MEFLPGALGGVRKFLDQIQPATREPDRLPIREPANVVVCCLLEILCRPLVIPPALGLHCKLGCNFPGTFAVYVLSIIPDASVQLDASECGYPFIKHVLIQRVYEAVTCHCLPARQFVDSAILNELTMPSQFITAYFKLCSILRQ